LSLSLTPPPPSSALFPYTTLFRSQNTSRMPLCIGLCGSSSVSQRAWCLRWMATHSFTIIEVVSQHQKRKKCASAGWKSTPRWVRSEEHTSELQSRENLVCRLLLEK